MRRAPARVALLLVTAATLLVGGATAASAHANLRSTDPAQSAVFPAGKPPAKVVLHFDEEVTVRSDAIKVFAPNGKPVADVAVRSGTWKDVSATLPKLSDGSFVVIYRVVSDDGHPEQGAVTFTVGAATATNASINGLLAAQASPRGLGVAYGVVRALAFLGAMVFVGGLCFVRWCWPSVLRSNPTRRLLVTTGAVGIAAALLAMAVLLLGPVVAWRQAHAPLAIVRRTTTLEGAGLDLDPGQVVQVTAWEGARARVVAGHDLKGAVAGADLWPWDALEGTR